ncbi:dITP/XTP pyrophosphatase [Burkholderiales bacterium]|nr:dITP/XTP pyrophosphatase [Burkholderiales bacterium]
MDNDAIAQRRLLLASDNPGKLAELRALLAPMGVRVEAQGALGIRGAEEPHGTFVENALAKARHAARASGWPALADDSGLCCLALDGAPGVRSARYAGENATDAQNNARLLGQLAGSTDRRAHYHCVVVAMHGGDDPEPLIADGRWDGEIVDVPQGSGGFGYDPHFWIPGLGCTAATLDAHRKNRISHRGIAMRALAALLRERWGW